MKYLTPGILAVAAGFIFYMIAGCLYLYGAISIYLASYYYLFDHSVRTRFLISFLPIRGILILFFLSYGTILEKKHGPRL